MRAEYARGAAAMALCAAALLAASLSLTWFEYEDSTGQRTPPDGAYNNGEDGVIAHELTFYATHWQGDIEPSNVALARAANVAILVGVASALAALAMVALGETPRFHARIHRRASLAWVGIAILAVAVAATLTWLWLPGSLAEYGVDSPFTARLDGHDDYTHTRLGWGWYSLALSFPFIIAAGLFKFQAGALDPSIVEELVAGAEA